MMSQTDTTVVMCMINEHWVLMKGSFFLSLLGEGSRSRSYGRTAVLRLNVQQCDEDDEKDDPFFLIFPSNGAPVELNLQGKTEVLGEKPVSMPLCPPQIPHGLTRDRGRASAVTGRRLTAWAMARPWKGVAWWNAVIVRMSTSIIINWCICIARSDLHYMSSAAGNTTCSNTWHQQIFMSLVLSAHVCPVAVDMRRDCTIVRPTGCIWDDKPYWTADLPRGSLSSDHNNLQLDLSQGPPGFVQAVRTSCKLYAGLLMRDSYVRVDRCALWDFALPKYVRIIKWRLSTVCAMSFCLK